LEEKIEENPDGSLKHVYSLTGTGKSLAKKIRDEIDDRTILDFLVE
jgi:DNA-binding PadR family transcriptional regulator